MAQDTTLARVLYEMNQDGYTGIRLSNQQSVNRVKHYYINELWTPQGWLYNVFNGTKESVLNPFTDNNLIMLTSNLMAEHTVQLVNALGATVWIRKVAVTEDENILTINDLQALPVGLYALRVFAPNGQMYTYKTLKQ